MRPLTIEAIDSTSLHGFLNLSIPEGQTSFKTSHLSQNLCNFIFLNNLVIFKDEERAFLYTYPKTRKGASTLFGIPPFLYFLLWNHHFKPRSFYDVWFVFTAHHNCFDTRL